MRSNLCAIATVLLSLPIASIEAQERAPFQVGEVQAAPGQRSSGFLEIPESPEEGTQVPVTVIHGGGDGPVLGLIAGTHGYEYAPILALQNVRDGVDPERLSGTLILLHVANVPSFLGRTISHLRMVERDPELAEGMVWLEDYEVVTSPATGVLRPAVRAGCAGAEGTLIGTPR